MYSDTNTQFDFIKNSRGYFSILLHALSKATIQNSMQYNTKNAESLFWLEYEQNQTIILWLESPLTVHTH